MYVSPPPETAVSLPDTLPTPFVHGQNNHLLCFCKQTWLRIWTAILVAFLQPHSLQPTRESFFAMLACYLNAKDNSKQKGKFGSSGQGQSRIFQRLSLKSHQHQTACKQCLPACCTHSAGTEAALWHTMCCSLKNKQCSQILLRERSLNSTDCNLKLRLVTPFALSHPTVRKALSN